jgi:allantoinase
VVWTDASQRGSSLSDVARWMALKTATLASLSGRVGALAPGCDANFVIFDPEAEFLVTPKRLHYRHKISPYMGARLRGVVKATYLRGENVYRYTNGWSEFALTARGEEYRFI